MDFIILLCPLLLIPRLRDDDRKSKQVISYLTKENEYTKAVLADTVGLQEDLYKEMRSRIQEADESVPVR
jgi:oligopeptidase B